MQSLPKHMKHFTIMFLSVFSILIFAQSCIIVDDHDNYDPYSAKMQCIISPSSVTPVYNSAYYEWRWYFNIQLEELEGIDIHLDSMIVDFYDLNGSFEYSDDYSDSISSGDLSKTCNNLHSANRFFFL